MNIDVVSAVREGKAQFDWSYIMSSYAGATVIVPVTRDSIKVGGVRWPVSAFELQTIADMLDCLLLTPKVIDCMWLQATTKIEPVINHTWPASQGRPARTEIVATLDPRLVDSLVDARIQTVGDSGGLIECVGKYWCLVNELLNHPTNWACNYGWCSSTAPRTGVTPGVKCWQQPGFRHDDTHKDPSQGARVMFAQSWLLQPGKQWERVSTLDILTDDKLSYLLSHQGKLRFTRQRRVQQVNPIGIYKMPQTPLQVAQALRHQV